MNILAIRFARLGDVILLLPALSSLKRRFPGSRLTLLTGHRCAPVAELCPAIDEVIAVNRLAMRDGPVWSALREIGRLVWDLRRKRFDLIVDFHSFRETNLLALVSGARSRIGMKRYGAPYLGFCFNLPPVLEDKRIHVADMFEKVVAGIPPASEPHSCPTAKPWLNVERRRSSGPPKIAFFVDAPVPERVWPAERFAEVADFVIEKFGFSVDVISSKERSHLAVAVRDFSRNPDQLSVCTDMNLRMIAQIIGSAVLFVSNDTGPMHLGPAVGTPTLGLFSVGFPEHFRPMGPNDRFLRSNPIHLIQAKDVIAVLEEMWATADRDLQC